MDIEEFKNEVIFEYRLREDIADLYEDILSDGEVIPSPEVIEEFGELQGYELELFVVWNAENLPEAVVGVNQVDKPKMLWLIESDGNRHEHIGFLCVSAGQVAAYLREDPEATLDTLHDEMIQDLLESFDLEPLAALSEMRSRFTRLQ